MSAEPTDKIEWRVKSGELRVELLSRLRGDSTQGSAVAQRALMPPLKGEVGRRKPSRRGLSEWRMELLCRFC